MAEEKKEDKGGGNKKEKPKPGEIFALLLAVGIGGGIALIVLGMGIGEFINAVGTAKRRFPEVVIGLVLIGLAVAIFAASKKDDH